MLKKKSGLSFKPKAAVRRNVPTTANRQSKTPGAATSPAEDAANSSTPATTAAEASGERSIDGTNATTYMVLDSTTTDTQPPVTTHISTSDFSQTTPESIESTLNKTAEILPPVESAGDLDLPTVSTLNPQAETLRRAEGSETAEPTSVTVGQKTNTNQAIITPAQAPTSSRPRQEPPSDTSLPTARSSIPTDGETSSGPPVFSPSSDAELAGQPQAQGVPSEGSRPTVTQASGHTVQARRTQSNASTQGKSTGPTVRQGRKRKAPAVQDAPGAPIEQGHPPLPAKRHRPTDIQASETEGINPTGAEPEHRTPASSRKRSAPKRGARATRAAGPPQTPAAELTEEEPQATSASKKRQPRARKRAQDPTASGGAESEINGQDTSARPRRRTPRTAATHAEASLSNDNGSSENAASGEDGADAAGSKPRHKQPNGRRRERSLTPEDAEEREVDPKSLTMADLTRDLRIGKKFSRHDELLERVKERNAKQRLARKLKKRGAANDGASGAQSAVGSGDEGDREGGSSAADGAGGDAPGAAARGSSGKSTPVPGPPISTAPAAQLAATGPQFEIIDGNIVINQASLVHDRHAAAAAEQEEMEVVEENDFTRMTNSSTYLRPGKLRGPNAWNAEETKLFYDYLRMFGTDFQTIANMFPGRTRRHVKMKFNREERHNPAEVNAALVGQKVVKISLDEYQSRTGKSLEATEAIEAEHRRREEAHEAEQKRIQDELDAAQREKRERLLGAGPGGGASGGSGAAAAGSKKGANTAEKGTKAGTRGGQAEEGEEEEEEVEIIDELEVIRPPPRRRARVGGGLGF